MFGTKCIFALSYQRFIAPMGVTNAVRRIWSSTSAVQKVNDHFNADLEAIEKIWQKDCNSSNVTKFLFERFSEEKNCYTYALNLLASASNQPSRLSFEILFAFKNWIKENSVTETLTADMKWKAVETVFHKRANDLHTLVFDIFQLQEQDASFREIPEKLIANGKYIEAAHYITLLGMQKDYPLEKVILPLLLSRNMMVVSKYLCGHPDLQKKLVKLLDELIARLNQNPNEVIQGKNASPRLLYKYLNVIINQFELPSDLCPNAHKIRIDGTLNFLVRKKLQKSITEKAWKEMVTSTVQNDVELQKKLIQKLVDNNDAKTALRMANEFCIPQNEWPSALLHPEENQGMEVEQNSDAYSVQETDCDISCQPEDYLMLELDPSNIHYINTSEGFLRCLESISQPGMIVGIDSEWKPFFMQRSSRLSLIQLAVANQVYILDMLALDDCFLEKHWDRFTTEFLANPDVLKLGCGIVQDIQMLVENYRGSKGEIIRFSHVLDMAILFQKMADLYEEDHKDSDIVSPNLKGLSRLCAITLGKPLNKVERACDWEERPLSDNQIAYAALDALCLLQMFESMQRYARKKGANFDHYFQAALRDTTSASKTAARPKKNIKWVYSGNYSFCFKTIMPIKLFKVVVNSELTDLGLRLRMYGVDVKIMNSSDIYKDNFKILLDEGRALVGSSVFHEKVKGLLPNEKYFIVAQDNQSVQAIVPFVFQHFNVHMSAKAIFSRCMQCNGDQFEEVSSDELRDLINNGSRNSVKQELQISNSLENSEQLPILHEHSEEVSVVRNTSIRINMGTFSSDVFTKFSMFRVCTNCGNVQSQR